MGGLAVIMFAGITALALAADVHMAENTAQLWAPGRHEQQTVIAQIGLAVFGDSVAVLLLQGFTAAILVLAANTAFNGFPILALAPGARRVPATAAREPRRPAGVLATGSSSCALVAALLIVAFDANVTRLIQLYILGVFVSFTLSQVGMVRHWSRELAVTAPETRAADASRPGGQRARCGCDGAGVRARAGDQVRPRRLDRGDRGPVLFLLMKAVSRHYQRALSSWPPRRRAPPCRAASTRRAGLQTARAAPCARWPSPGRPAPPRWGRSRSPRRRRRTVVDDWADRGVPVPLVVIESPYREIVRPVLTTCATAPKGASRRRHVRDSGVRRRPVVEHLLHNQTALRLKGRLLFERGVRHDRSRGAWLGESSRRERAGHRGPHLGPARRDAARAIARGLSPQPLPPATGLVVAAVLLPALTALVDVPDRSRRSTPKSCSTLLAVVVLSLRSAASPSPPAGGGSWC